MGLLALVLAVVLTAGTLTPTMAQDNAEDNGFTERSLEGSWGFSAHGVSLEDDAVIHGVAVGLFAFDGEGECSFSFTGNFGGFTATGTAEECTYEVNSDGTGSIELRIEKQPEEMLSFVLVDEANEFHFITLGSDVFSGVAKRQ